MFNNYQPFGFNNMPNMNQPFGFNPYMQPNTNIQQSQMQQQPQQPTMATNTNKIFVSSIEDVKNRQLPFNSDFIFLDNDKPILYQKTIDSKGQFEVKAFDITPHNDLQDTKEVSSINLSDYVLKTDLKALQEEIKGLKEKVTRISVQNQMETMKKGE